MRVRPTSVGRGRQEREKRRGKEKVSKGVQDQEQEKALFPVSGVSTVCVPQSERLRRDGK